MPSIKIYSKEQVDDLISGVVPPTVVQTTGSSTTDVMSQNAVTTALGNKADTSALPTSSQLVPSTSGASSGDVLSFNGTSTEWTQSGGGNVSIKSNKPNSWANLANFLTNHIDNLIGIQISGSVTGTATVGNVYKISNTQVLVSFNAGDFSSYLYHYDITLTFNSTTVSAVSAKHMDITSGNVSGGTYTNLAQVTWLYSSNWTYIE